MTRRGAPLYSRLVMEPLQAPGLPVPGESLPPEPVPVQNFAVDPAAITPGDPNSKIRLGEVHEKTLCDELSALIDNHDQAMKSRWERLGQIKRNYNLVVDESTTGRMPFSQQLVSEMTRAHTNTATARLTEGIMNLHPYVLVSVWDDQDSSPETQELVLEAKATEKFFESYFPGDMRGKDWLPMAIHRSVKLGDSIVRLRWEQKDKHYWYKASGGKRGKPKKKTLKTGRVAVDLIGNEQMIVWPLHGLSIRDQQAVGHRDFQSPSEFRSLAKQLKVPADTMGEIVARAVGSALYEQESRKSLLDDMAGKDINLQSLMTLKGEVEIIELWLTDYYLPGSSEPGNYHLFYYKDLKKLLHIEPNPHNCQQHGYFCFPYWREDNSVWSSGVGHETLYNQKTDSALLNMHLDNMKIVGNLMRIVKSGSMAESNQNELYPGKTVVTEDPVEDFRTASLGGDLQSIQQAIEANELRGMKNSGIPHLLGGMGDPTLKSGASPGSYQQLIAEAGKKFGQIDSNMRQPLSDCHFFALELIQQYATEDILYASASDESARRILRGKYRPPEGSLRDMFRMTPKAPSATSNHEVLMQRLMLTFQLVKDYTPLIFQIVDQTMAPANPTGAEAFKHKMLEFVQNDLMVALVEKQEISGLASRIPKISEATPQEEQMNEMIQQNEQLQQQLQQMQQQMQPPEQPGMPPGMPPGPPGMPPQQGGFPGA